MYVKPVVQILSDISEGVYAASGTPGCDSKYMNSVWQGQDNSDWNGGTRGYKQQFGCLGCPAYTENGCGLNSHYVESDYAGSYDTDNGNRIPSWERKGYTPDETVTDWDM